MPIKPAHMLLPFLIVLVAGCATPDVDRSLAGFDEGQFKRDTAECHVYPVGLPVAFSVAGAVLCIINVPPPSLEVLIGEAAVCGAAGFAFGTYVVIDDFEGTVKKCLGDKGYQVRG